MVVFGTRPEIIKLSPVITALALDQTVELSCVFTGQQENLAPEFLEEFAITVSKRLSVMQPGQSLSSLLAKLIAQLEDHVVEIEANAMIVQGDTTSALAAALVGNLCHIPVFHVEAGLRTFNPASPFPEETNRKLIGQLVARHFAATEGNRKNLLKEGIAPECIAVTGNPIVDIVEQMLQGNNPSAKTKSLLESIQTPKLIVLTAHRRENFDALMGEYFSVLRDFIVSNSDYTLLIPVHPNPVARDLVSRYLGNHERIMLSEPFGYKDFLAVLNRADLIVSDSGGIQEEVVSLNRPLIILRETTERPEAVECGIAQMAPTADVLKNLLGGFHETNLATRPTRASENPFGNGNAGKIIADDIRRFLEKGRSASEI